MHQEEAFGLFLGHVRLSVVDLDGAINPCGTKTAPLVSFNGEIYNHQELRHDLRPEGTALPQTIATRKFLFMAGRNGERPPLRLNGCLPLPVG